MADRIAARITELTEHQATLARRSTADIAGVQAQIDALTKAQGLLTPELEAAFLALESLKLVTDKQRG